uniref:Ribosomal protein L29 n=1 Tax=Gelidium elegans TaxID=37200 RepID=A0A141SDT9_GELEL|nr:ribosomal protein L29 [Gelidium elegans]AMK96457.1 ribosomal protein L29 [Gelidium elegans]
MGLPNINEVNKYNITEIKEEIIATKRELLNLSIKRKTQQDIKSHLFKHTKRKLAQLLTIKSQINKL